LRYKVIISDVAWSHFDDLYDYVAVKAGVPVAESFVGGIHQFLFKLEEFPRLGKPRNSAKVPNLHTVFRGNTVVAYTVDKGITTVTILGVFYGGQDYESYLEIDTSGE
jgi:plasmid stabilization system protein ParE